MIHVAGQAVERVVVGGAAVLSSWVGNAVVVVCIQVVIGQTLLALVERHFLFRAVQVLFVVSGKANVVEVGRGKVEVCVALSALEGEGAAVGQIIGLRNGLARVIGRVGNGQALGAFLVHDDSVDCVTNLTGR